MPPKEKDTCKKQKLAGDYATTFAQGWSVTPKKLIAQYQPATKFKKIGKSIKNRDTEGRGT